MTNETLSEHDIINYLQKDTDFFIRHPEQLLAINVSNRSGKIASLINHQVNVLKERNQHLKDKLNEMIKYAEYNEKIMAQIFELTLRLSQISHVANVTKYFCAFVKKAFDCNMIRIIVPVYDKLNSNSTVLCVENEEPFTSLFNEFMRSNRPICGRLRAEKLKFVFGKKADKIGSSVMLPIGDNAEKGVLIFASEHESRFHPDMSTDLLSRLAQILEFKLSKTFSLESEQQA
jgi:uncharacterized protein YigA (DUF484 family)